MTPAERSGVQASPPLRLPDFVIAGAMKCGTTSLRHILSQHPRVFIPDHEIFYYSLDDLQQHPHFFGRTDGEWRYHDVEGRAEEYRRWYSTFFDGAGPDQLIGENSTSYIASPRALDRMAADIPTARVIVMLREPVRRAYSHYWHMVRAGRTGFTFEECIQYYAPQIVGRSCYRRQIEHLLRVFPRQQVHFIVFERFIATMDETVQAVLDFLELPGAIELKAVETRRNVGRYPRSLRLELMRNRLLGSAGERVPVHLPDVGVPPGRLTGSRGVLSRLARRFNPRQTTAHPMATGTRRFLTDYLHRENRGLSALIGQDLEAYWYPEKDRS